MLRSKVYIYIFVSFLLLRGTTIGEPSGPPQPNYFSKILGQQSQIFKISRAEDILQREVIAQESFLLPLKGPIEITEDPILRLSKEILPDQSSFYWGELLTLSSCFEQAQKIYGPLQIAKEQMKLAKLRLKETRRNLLPSAQIEAEGTEGTTIGEDFRGRGTELKVQQPIWNGGKQWKLYKQAKINYTLAETNYRKVYIDLEAEVKKAFYLCVQTRLNLDEQEKFLALAENIRQSSQRRYEKELIREVEWLSVENLVQEIEYKTELTRNEWTLAQLALRQLLGFYEDDPLNVETNLNYTLLSIDLEESLTLAFGNRPEYLLSQLNYRVAEYEKEIVFGDNGIRVDLDGSIGYRAEAFDSEDLDYDDEFFVGVRASIPFWHHKIETNTIVQDTVPSAGQTTSTDFKSQTVSIDLFNFTGKSSRLEAEINLKKAKEDFNKAKRNTLFDLKEAYYQCQSAINQVKATQANKKLRIKESELMKIQVGLNEANLSQLLESYIKQTDALIEANVALQTYFTSISQFNHLMGLNHLNPHSSI